VVKIPKSQVRKVDKIVPTVASDNPVPLGKQTPDTLVPLSHVAPVPVPVPVPVPLVHPDEEGVQYELQSLYIPEAWQPLKQLAQDSAKTFFEKITEMPNSKGIRSIKDKNVIFFIYKKY
jgi:hypothetical protein